MKKLAIFSMFLFLMSFGALAQAAPMVDVIQAPTDYFVPTDAQKYDFPYYRGVGEDWGWTHNAIGGTITSAVLGISAFDVDYDGAPPSFPKGERDEIFAYDDGVKTSLGFLEGANDIWNYTEFTLGSSFYNDINAGLIIWMEIDENNEGWYVSLAKSSLSIDGGTPPPPTPGAVPIPATALLIAPGLAGLAAIRRKMQK